MRKIKATILLVIMSLCMVFGVACSLLGGSQSSSAENSTTTQTRMLQSIQLSNTKTSFAYGEEFSVGDLVVTAVYSDGSMKAVTGYTVDVKNFSGTAPGKYNIVIHYEEAGTAVKQAYIATVGNSEVVVALELKNVKTDYFYGENFWFSGVVQEKYEDGHLSVVEDYEVDSSAYNSKVTGEYEIIVSRNDLETKFTVNVLPSKTATEMNIINQTTTFTVGDKFVFDGVLTVAYEDGRVEEGVETYEVDSSRFDAFKVGEQEITVLSGGMEYTYTVTVEKATRLRLLMIGNSFSQDTVKWMADIAKSVGFTDILIGNLVIGGCDISKHYSNSQKNARDYGFEYYNGTRWSNHAVGTKTMEEGILAEDWDYISLQQASPKSGNQATYNADISNLAAYVKETATNENVQVIWNMTWAYQTGYSGLSAYMNNQMTMYEMITASVQNKIETNEAFATVSPVGTAIQNARTSYLGDNLTRDGFHLLTLKGRYISGLTMFCLLTGYSPFDVTYRPPTKDTFEGKTETMTDEDVLVAKESVANALANKYSVTNSQYVD